jgi:hypothetical protein
MMDIDRFANTAAWLEHCDGMTRFHAENEAARRQGVRRWEVLGAIRKRDPQPVRHSCSKAERQSKDDLSSLQSCTQEETGPVSECEFSTGRGGLEMLALRA